MGTMTKEQAGRYLDLRIYLCELERLNINLTILAEFRINDFANSYKDINQLSIASREIRDFLIKSNAKSISDVIRQAEKKFKKSYNEFQAECPEIIKEFRSHLTSLQEWEAVHHGAIFDSRTSS